MLTFTKLVVWEEGPSSLGTLDAVFLSKSSNVWEFQSHQGSKPNYEVKLGGCVKDEGSKLKNNKVVLIHSAHAWMRSHTCWDNCCFAMETWHRLRWTNRGMENRPFWRCISYEKWRDFSCYVSSPEGCWRILKCRGQFGFRAKLHTWKL